MRQRRSIHLHAAVGAVSSAVLVAVGVVAAPASGLSYNPCPTGQPGMTSTFWNQYQNWSYSDRYNDAVKRASVGDNTLIRAGVCEHLAGVRGRCGMVPQPDLQLL